MQRRTLSVDVSSPPSLRLSGHAIASLSKSPVQRRLEKRCRSPGKCVPFALALDGPSMAKKRREQLLRAQVESNARRVAHAKEVARAQSERQREAAAELAASIAQRQRDAESRREAFLVSVRARASPRVAPPSPSGPDAAQRRRARAVRLAQASRRRASELERRAQAQREHLAHVRVRCEHIKCVRSLQRWWRRAAKQSRQTRALVAPGGLAEALTTILRAAPDEFDAVAEHLASPDVVAAARALLDHVRGGVARTTPSMARALLAAFMVEHHADTVLGPAHGRDAPMRDAVAVAAGRMLRVMHRLHETLCARPVSRRAAAVRVGLLRASHLAYARAFAAWKEADAKSVAAELLMAHAAISQQRAQLLRAASADPAAAAHDAGMQQHLAGTLEQLASLRARAGHLVRGAALQRWHAAADAHLTHAAQQQDVGDDDEQDEQDLRQAEQHGNSQATAVEAALPERSELLPRAPSNERMVHELLLDADFSLSADAHAVVDLRSLDEAGALSQRLMAQQLASCDGRAFASVVAAVRSRLAALTPSRHDLAAQLRERLDEDLLAQQVSNGAFAGPELLELVRFLGDRVMSLQAPARGEATRAWLAELHETHRAERQPWTELAPRALDMILRDLGAIDLDLANFHLRVLGDRMREGDAGAMYLRSAFATRLDAGEYARGNVDRNAPQNTERWLRAALDALQNGSAAQQLTPPPSPRLGPGSSSRSSSEAAAALAPSVAACVAEGMLRAVLDDADSEDPLPGSLPETLREHDLERFRAFRSEARALCRVAVADMTISQALRIAGCAAVPPSALTRHRALLLSLVREDLHALDVAEAAPPLKALARDLLAAASQQRGAALPENAARALEAMLGQGALLGTVSRQLETVLRKLLRDATYADTCLHALKKIGLDAWAQEVVALAEKMRGVLELNVAVHGPLYTHIRAQWAAQQ